MLRTNSSRGSNVYSSRGPIWVVIPTVLVVVGNLSFAGEFDEDAALRTAIEAQVLDSLPYWDATLASFESIDEDSFWAEYINEAEVAEAFDDTLPEHVDTDADKVIYSDDGRLFLFEEHIGNLFYKSFERSFVYQESSTVPVEIEVAEDIAVSAALEMGVSESQLGEIVVDSVLLRFYENGNPTPLDTVVKETMVTIKREINGIPVAGSRIRFRISNDGEISRVTFKWPDFFYATECTGLMKSEADVVDEISSKIIDDFGYDVVDVTQELSFVFGANGRGYGYAPGVTTAVQTGERPGILYSTTFCE